MLYKPRPISSDDRQQSKPRLTIGHERLRGSELQWTKKEKTILESRILPLRDDQLAALLEITGLGFKKEEIDDVVHDIKIDGLQSGYLEILLSEADSKENLLWWLTYFERFLHNNRN
jgi:hypothetical protein